MPFRLLGILVLGLTCSVNRKTVNERDDNLLDVDLGVQLRRGGEEGAESVEVEVVREDLDYIGVGTPAAFDSSKHNSVPRSRPP